LAPKKPERQIDNKASASLRKGGSMLEVKVERCAGIDVHKKFVMVCVMIGLAHQKPASEVRRFGTSVPELERLKAWLVEKGCTDVVMESTGSYWKPIFNILESDFRVILANAEKVKALRGKKTDPNDSRWLAGLLRHGLIQPSFIPPKDIRELRDLTRRRRSLLQQGASERNRIQKILEDANVKIGNVLTDVFGMSGQAMLEALLENKMTAEQIADLAQGRLRPKIPQIVESLVGHSMTDHHRMLLRHILKHMAFIEDMIGELDKEIGEKLRPYEKQVQLACSVPGIGRDAAASILAETGPDMSDDGPFPSCHALASWAGICPGNNESGGKRKNGRTRKANRWLRATLGQTSWAGVAKKNSSYRDRYHRLKPRRGAQRAITAVCHAQLIDLYWVLRTGVAYQEQTQQLNQQRRQSMIRHHLKRLEELGYEPA
jgi:transposase